MTAGLVIAVLLCAGGNCEMIKAEPGISYPSYEQCSAAIATKTRQLSELAAQYRRGARRAETVCVQETTAVSDVEAPYDVMKTSIIHAEPNAASPYVGLAESGQRMLVTGLVTGANWVRVLLPDGNTGYFYGDHVSKVTANTAAAPMQAPPRICAVVGTLRIVSETRLVTTPSIFSATRCAIAVASGIEAVGRRSVSATVRRPRHRLGAKRSVAPSARIDRSNIE